ncbi:MAG: hypothetical protein ACXV5H_09830 [Halobacteriota archaeon]
MERLVVKAIDWVPYGQALIVLYFSTVYCIIHVLGQGMPIIMPFYAINAVNEGE